MKKWRSMIILLLVLCFLRFDVVISGSMTPTIEVGSLVIYTVLKKEIYEIQDIIIFKQGDMKVMHRIVDVNDAYTTKGDANDVEDSSPVLYNQILGHYICHIPYLGYAFFYVKKYILVIILLLLLEEILWKRKKSLQD